MDLFKTLLFVHIVCGGVSLLLGLYVLLAKKGTAIHKRIGRTYFYCMLTAALVSFPLSYLHPNYFLFIIGVFTSYMLLTGKRYLTKKKITDVKQIDWVLALVMLIFGIAFIVFGIYKLMLSNSFGIVFLVFGGVSILFVWQDNGNFRGRARYQNYWLTTHIQRMIGSYIATVTAFLVVNNKILPDVVAWLLPTFLLVPLIIKWLKKYSVRALKTEQNSA